MNHLKTHVAAVAGEDLRFGINPVLGIVDRDTDFADAGRDQFDLAIVARRVAGGIDARQVGLHVPVDDDIAALQFQSPLP